MTLNKPSGAISGRQETQADGSTLHSWSHQFAPSPLPFPPQYPTLIRTSRLPEGCALSDGLRREAESLLAALLEVSPSNRLSYDGFFERAEALAARVPLHILHLPTAAFHTSYNQTGLAREVARGLKHSDLLPQVVASTVGARPGPRRPQARLGRGCC